MNTFEKVTGTKLNYSFVDRRKMGFVFNLENWIYKSSFSECGMNSSSDFEKCLLSSSVVEFTLVPVR